MNSNNYNTKSFLLTIAIPTYNRANILHIALGILLPQINNYSSEIELIISDNASNDNTQKVIKDLLSQYPTINSIIYTQKNNSGYFGNFKKCRELSKGVFFWLLSDNDHIGNNLIEMVMECLVRKIGTSVIYLRNIDSAKFLVKHYNLNSFFNNENSYLITLISSAIFRNDKSLDHDIYSNYSDNLFLGFLLLINSLNGNDRILQISGRCFKSYPATNSYNYFTAFTKDINQCLNYMTDRGYLTKRNKNLFINGILKNIIYPYLINLNLNSNGLTTYDETKKKIKNSLDAYYSTNKYYLSCITKLFHSSSFTLKLKQVNFIIKKKIHKYYLQISN